jgi:HSP20 family molecular chaperone IbpA
VRLLLAGLVGALLASVVFLSVMLLRSPPPAAAPAAAAARSTAPDPADPLGGLFGRGLQDMMRDMQQRMRGFGGGGGFTLRLGGDDLTLDVEEEGDAVVVVARIQDAVEGKFDVKVDGRLFTLRGERRVGQPGMQASVSFSQSVSLPADVDPTKMTSEFKDGVLRVRLPKKR